MTGPERFTYDALGGRVVFGPGTLAQLPGELDALGAERVVLLASDRHAGAVRGLLGDRVAGHFGDVAQHVPVARALEARALTTELKPDALLAVGGGTAIGFGKALLLDPALDVPLVAVPTTYSGSEMTTIWGLTEGGTKRTGSDAKVKPQVVVYDPELTLGLPPQVSGPSGMNALAHGVEALYGPRANPVASLMAIEGMRALHRSLPAVCAVPGSLGARTEALYGAYLAGAALASAGTALHHTTCHVLGGLFGLDHAGTHAVVLGHALAYNAPAVPEAVARVEEALGVPPGEAPGALCDLATAVGAPDGLAALGMPVAGLDEATRRVVAEAARNVRPPEPDGIRRMLEDAYLGRRPGAAPADR
jgi:maleylacetate reductase